MWPVSMIRGPVEQLRYTQSYTIQLLGHGKKKAVFQALPKICSSPYFLFLFLFFPTWCVIIGQRHAYG